MSELNMSLGQRLASCFAGNDTEFGKVIESLMVALERGDSCLLLSSAQVKVVQSQSCVASDGTQPFVLEGERFYLQRYWLHEVKLAERLKSMALNEQTLAFDISAYFTDEHQQAAAELALTHQLALITGGPGTGKTTTVVKILTLLLMQNPELKIALAAPTGKAAMRLTESITKGKSDEAFVRSVFADSLAELDAVPSEGKTLHRLLGVRPLSPEFKHDAENPLSADVVVVDEASMIDIGMMSRLIQALKPSAKLIMMGDQDQLASVETGAVLADMCKGLPNNRVHLQNTYRFGGAIKDLALAVNASNADAALTVLANGGDMVTRSKEDPVQFAKREYAQYWSVVNDSASTQAQIFKAFDAFQVLCATRRDKARFDALAGQQEEWYAGRPVMILENHAELGLFNGDIGIALSNESDQLQVYFPMNGEFKAFMPAQLPEHETAFAMTIHKSQGSEFAHVLIVLPELPKDQEQAKRIQGLLTKELLYTGITRAKKKVSLHADDAVLESSIQNAVERVSGLVERLV